MPFLIVKMSANRGSHSTKTKKKEHDVANLMSVFGQNDLNAKFTLLSYSAVREKDH